MSKLGTWHRAPAYPPDSRGPVTASGSGTLHLVAAGGLQSVHRSI